MNKKVQSTQTSSECRNQFHPQSADNLDPGVKPLDGSLPAINVVGSPITALPLATQIEVMLKWASRHESKVVCVANTHMLMEAYWHPALSSVLKSADLVTPDGMPLVWMMRLMGAFEQNRLAGMDILWSLCQLAPRRNISMFFLGSEETILERMRTKLEQNFLTFKSQEWNRCPFTL
jgi:N-acetylglucosaminyldiphosphoundecaprenol N-acetyl-beta-D-mannosaminyltransferase